MSDREKLRRLAEISALMRDTRMLALEAAARARQASLDRLAELDRPSSANDLPPIVAGEVAMRYALWADRRRSELNQMLARQTVEWHQARDEAALAFGRDQGVGKLAGRPR
jgi:hypothetical protein